MRIYNQDEITIIVPTRNRPEKVKNLLESIISQSLMIKNIIIIASGQDIRDVVLTFKNKLNIDYLYTDIIGQVRQRKIGLSRVNSNTKLIMTLDDDVIFEKNSFENMLSFINNSRESAVGFAFNLTNMQKHNYSRIKEIFWLSHPNPGKVLESGYITSLVNIDSSIRTDWLIGGASIWKTDILIENISKHNKNEVWSPCEDVIFSYPIGQQYELWVCAEAKAIHDDSFFYSSSFEAFRRGVLLSEWVYLFVSLNSKLKVSKFIVATFFSGLFIMFRKIYSYEFFFQAGRLYFLFNFIFKKILKSFSRNQ